MGLSRGLSAPSPAALEEYRVNQADQREIVYAPLYDKATYAQAGQTSLTLFVNPVGQSSKTLADTNMTLAGQLPAPQSFLVTSIHVELLPPALPGRAAAAATAIATNINDIQEVMQSGWLELTIGTKVYTQEGPLGVFPPTYRLDGLAALAAAGEVADKMNIIDYGQVVGEYYEVLPYAIPQSQNFKVTLNWPAVVAITAATPIFVRLGGFLYRSVQ
jgi:hypothetical protein